MILKRMASAIKRQDWFQVTIEVMIVIVGIFLGLQVQAWYEEQADQAQEAIYLTRMHEELLDVLNNVERVAEARKLTLSGISSAVPVISRDNSEVLSDQQCNAIYGSHVLVKSPVDMPLITELLASGRLSLISNERLKTLISRLVINEKYSNDQLENLRSDKLDFTRKYPNLIRLTANNDENRKNSNKPDGIYVSCDLEAMRKNEAFVNDFLGVRLRFGGFMRNLQIQSNTLNELHVELDNILSLTH